MSNYPDGVTDAHPHFNPQETTLEVQCQADEALVVPSFAVKAALIELAKLLERIPTGTAAYAPSPAVARKKALELVKQLQADIDEMEQESTYECGHTAEYTLAVSDAAEFDCERCGRDQTTDTTPDEREDDDAYDRMRDDRHDD